MNEAIKNLEPKAVWKNFANLNAVPRASKKEARVIAFMKKFGEDLGLETMIDKVGNVIIKKPATPGMENRKTVVLQSHLDMVHQKNAETDFDFDTQGIQMYLEGDWVRAKGTTLGADNGLGVATIMAILESKNIPHPAIEALFTIDEETGMTGAMGLEGGMLDGEILLNLDTEEDDEIGVGCAGGIDVTAQTTYEEVGIPSEIEAYQIHIKGLQGGHSGMDIHKGFGNANKLLNRILFAVLEDSYLAEVTGGSLRNAIPREGTAIVLVSIKATESFKSNFENIKNDILEEYKFLEPDLEISLNKAAQMPQKMMQKEDQERFIKTVYATHNGVYRMSPAIADLVETSNNVAKITAKAGSITIACLTRSSVESSKIDMVNALTSVFDLGGFSTKLSGNYPGWAPNMDSPILKVLEKLYTDLHNGEKPNVAACHAGLECGILGQNYPKMDMISFGPTIKGAHSPDERASISSTQKFWKYLLEILKNIPAKEV